MPNTKIQADRQFNVASDISFGSSNGTNGNQLIGLKNPRSGSTGDLDAANKLYVDSVASGLDIKNSCRVATMGGETMTVVSGAVTQINGTTVDGVTLAIGDRVLIKNAPISGSNQPAQPNGTSSAANGIYRVTGNTTNLTVVRDTDADTSAEVTSGMFTFIVGGTINATFGFVLITQGAITLNTTALTFTQFSSASQITPGDGLTQSGNAFNVVGTAGKISVGIDSIDIDSNYIGQGSITTVGTITSGTWNGAVIDVQRGGSGRNAAVQYMPILGGTTTTGAHRSVANGTTNGQVLVYNGNANDPTFSSLNLAGGTNVITGTLPVGNGGTGTNTFTAGVVFGSGTNALTTLSTTTNGQVLRYSGSTYAFGSIDLASANTVGTSILSVANGGTGISTAPTANGQIHIGQSNGTFTVGSFTSSGGTVAITYPTSTTINLEVSSTTALTAAKFIFNETPTGTINGTNTVFTLAQTPVLNKVMVFVNGVLQAGGNNDYAITGSTITFQSGSIPQTGDFVSATYIQA